MGSQTAWGNHLFERLMLGLSVIPTTTVSSVLVALTQNGWYSTGSLLVAVQDHRATVQIIVQVISTILAALQLYSIGQILQFRLNLQICERPIKIDTIKLFNSLVLGRIDHGLPIIFALLTVGFTALVHLPGAFWAGAITPLIGSANLTTTARLRKETQETFMTGDTHANCAEDMTGKLQGVVQSASSFDSFPPKRAKMDNTGYSFIGKSYGVGSAVGLFALDTPGTLFGMRAPKILSYTFNELGFNSQVSCWNQTATPTNPASNLTIYKSRKTQLGDWNITSYYVNGSLPNGVIETIPGWYSKGEAVFAAAGVVSADESEYMYGLTGKYESGKAWYIDNVTCSVAFWPTLFRVDVDTSAANITVTPLGNSTVDGSAPPLMVRRNAFMQLPRVSIVATSLFAPNLGDVLLSNVHTVTTRPNDTVGYEKNFLMGIQESAEAMIDAGFSSIGAAQLIISHDNQTLPATITVEVVRLGDPTYIYVSFGLNLLLFLLLLLEVVRTSGWRRLPAFNSLDIKSAILAAAAGDKGLEEAGKEWNGDASDRLVGGKSVIVDNNRSAFRLVEQSASVHDLSFQGQHGHEYDSDVPLRER